MNKDEIIKKVKELNLPENSYVVFGSAPMAIAGLRESGDIDMMATSGVCESLEGKGWQRVSKGNKDTPLTRDVFEVHKNWEFSSYSPTLGELLKTAIVVDGVPFASLEEVRKWKSAWGRPKDIKDIELIDGYLARR